MRLNGIKAEPGTIIGYHQKHKRFLTVDSVDDKGCVLRFATQAELDSIENHEPRSIVEHRGIHRHVSPYGLVRQHLGNWKPTGFRNEPVDGVHIRVL